MIRNIQKYLLFLSWVPALFLSGCLGVRHLKENEKMLYRQGISAPKGISEDDLSNLYAQEPNRKILNLPIAPLVGIYYLGLKHYDQDKLIKKKEKKLAKIDRKIAKTNKQKRVNNLEYRKQQKTDKYNDKIENGNTVMQWGEPISVFDSTLLQATSERMHDYLYSKGYFLNKVSSKVTTLGKFVNVSYKVEPGPAYFIDSIAYAINDTTIVKILKQQVKGSYLKTGAPYDQNNFSKEQERIDLILKDQGYFDFSRQYVEFAVDTAILKEDHSVAVLLIINEPAKRDYHKQFVIDEVHFVTDAGVTNTTERNQEQYRSINYSYYQDIYKLKILSQRVFLKPGEMYSRSKTINTQRQLANVDAFKFVNVNYDTTGGKFIANIFTNPLPRYEWSNEAGVNVTQGFPGPFYNMTFKKRNIFRGLESLDLSGRFGFEGVASATQDQDFYKSTEAGVNASLTFPQFIGPFSEERRFKHAAYNPKTKLTIGYAYTDRPEYRRTAIVANGTYSWQNNKGRSYQLTPINLGIIDTSDLSTDFKELLAEQAALGNYSLLNSFRPSFVNSIIFGVTWNYKNYGNVERTSGYVRAQIESGGTIWNFIDPTFITENLDLQYFKYIRFSLDVRRNHVLSKLTNVAYRLNSGFAWGYADNKSLPYEKFFFAGGSNSLRAWRPRRLGPGSFRPLYTYEEGANGDPVEDGLFDYSVEQPAEILIEASVELRQKLFGFVSGALFLDIGNVWTFEQRKIGDDAEYRGNSQFKLNEFYKELAVGTGFGLRFDFTFLILRLDVGMKVWDPARAENDRFVLDKVRFFKPYATDNGDGTYSNFREPVIYNVGIGYPF